MSGKKKELLLFKTGNYPQGKYSKEFVTALADEYGNGLRALAPFVPGHYSWEGSPIEKEAAMGWVESVTARGGNLYADDYFFTDDAKARIAAGEFRYMSVGIDRGNEDKPHINHIALLGRSEPAVPGAKLPAVFSAGIKGEYFYHDEDSGADYFTRRLAKDLFTQGEASDNRGGEDEMEKKDMRELEEFRRREAALAEKEAAFAKKEAEAEKERRKGEAAAFYRPLADGGKMSPAEFDKAVSIDGSLSDEARAAYRESFSGRVKQFDLSGVSRVSQPKTSGGGPLTEKISRFAKEKALSYEEAAGILYEKEPGLFAKQGE